MKNKIKNKMLPKGLRKFIKDQKSKGGTINLSFNKIESCIISHNIITDCIYITKDTKLEWFTQDKIFYIFVDDKNFCHFSKKDGLVYSRETSKNY